MDRYRKILVAVDGSDSSVNAFRQACKIARESKSWITVLATIPPYSDQFQTLKTHEKIGKTMRAEAGKVISGIEKVAGEEDVFIRSMLEEGYPADAIADIADEGSYGLIVMGRHGKGRIERTLMGSVTARVIAQSTKDVLVVPGKAELGFKHILLCTDGSKNSGEAFERAVAFAKAHEGKLTAVSVVDVSEEFYVQAPEAVEQLIERAKNILIEMKKKAEAFGVKAELFVKEGDSHAKIVELASAKKAEVIFMGSHGRTGLSRLIMGSVTEKVIGLSPCPVFVSK